MLDDRHPHILNEPRNAESRPPDCAKTHSVGLIETADGALGPRYRGNPIGTVIAVYLLEGMWKELLSEYE
jgi:hypothetical protein